MCLWLCWCHVCVWWNDDELWAQMHGGGEDVGDVVVLYYLAES